MGSTEDSIVRGENRSRKLALQRTSNTVVQSQSTNTLQKINNPPPGNNAWVGIYPVDADDREHDDRWRWLRDIDVDNATLPGQSKGMWSIRLFSDGGYTLHERTDFEILRVTKMKSGCRTPNMATSDSRA